jgi:hypothetical protein
LQIVDYDNQKRQVKMNFLAKMTRLASRTALLTQPPREPSSFPALFNEHGVLKSSRDLSAADKRSAALYFDFSERSLVAMAAAVFYPGGDYFEFGSEGLATFRSFLTAFDLTSKIDTNPDVRFYAFDIFGDMTGAKDDLDYFKGWSDPVIDRYEGAIRTLNQHGLFLDRCHLVRGFFDKTLSPEFKSRYLSEGRQIGFAFLDCNITNSYRTVFEFLNGAMMNKSFVYMDEYYCNDDVPGLFEAFCAKNKRRPMFIRSAGAFGALFQTIKT